MGKFFQLKPHGYEIIVLLLIVGAFFGIREIYGDIFRGDGFWKNVGFALCFGALIVAVAVAFAMVGKHNSISFVSIVSVLSSLALIWYVFDVFTPETQFKLKKQAYIDNVDVEYPFFGGKFMAWDVKEEFLSENEISERLFKDSELIGEMMRDLQVRERWHDLKSHRSYLDYFNEALICYASLRERGFSDEQIFEKPNGGNIFIALFFICFQIEKENFIPIIHPKLQTHFNHFKADFEPNFKRLINRELNEIAQHNLYEMEMLLYFLTQVPTQISDAKFSELMDKWKTIKPVYKANIEELATARNILKIVFEGLKNGNSVGVNIIEDNYNSIYGLKEIRPFFNLTGIETEKGSRFGLCLFA